MYKNIECLADAWWAMTIMTLMMTVTVNISFIFAAFVCTIFMSHYGNMRRDAKGTSSEEHF